ncbi:hypothetical protein DENSPDRAFT_38551 [Dentipellis sp. KUC8613]|nr:hypothetical protein DENSPDRAFT_38551 [Dentipellis sp. KUC8613]
MFRAAIYNARPRPCAHELFQVFFSSRARPSIPQPIIDDGGDLSSYTRQGRKRRQSKAATEPTRTVSHPQSGDLESGKRLLLPFELSKRILKKCQQNSIDAAIDLLKNAPKDAQNVKVWNTMIQECLKAGKYQQAFLLFVDMKRRGFAPTLRTYATLLLGYSKITDWDGYSKQLMNVTLVYDQLKEYIEESGDALDVDAATTLFPIAIYIEILGNAGLQEKAFDVFHDLPQHGRLAPDAKIYSSIITAIAKRQGQPGGDVVAQMTYIWRRFARAKTTEPHLALETRAVESLVNVLSQDPSQKTLLLDVLHECLGLSRPGEAPSEAEMPINHHLLTAVFKAAQSFEDPSICEEYLQQCLRDPYKREHLRHWHIASVLRSLEKKAEKGSQVESKKAVALMKEAAELGPKQFTSTRAMWNLALVVCWKCRDWASAAEVSQVMSRSKTSPVASSRLMDPTPEEWEHTFRAAMATREPLAIRHCLGLFDTFSFDTLRRADISSGKASPITRSLASLVVRAVRSVMPPASSTIEEGEEMKRWQAMKDIGEHILYRDRKSRSAEGREDTT